MIVSECLKSEVEKWVAEFRLSTLAKLKARRLTPRAVAWYLESLRYLLCHTEPNLHLAARRALERGDSELAVYFRRKAGEEDGHDRWAEDDLKAFEPTTRDGLRPAQQILDLADLQRVLIDEHPLCYAAYALWVEYIMVLLGDEWLDMFEECGFPPTRLSAVANHLEADRDHAAYAFAQLDELWRGQPAIETLCAVVQRGGLLFEGFCEELHEQCNPRLDKQAS
jgi:hypothetical protein